MQICKIWAKNDKNWSGKDWPNLVEIIFFYSIGILGVFFPFPFFGIRFNPTVKTLSSQGLLADPCGRGQPAAFFQPAQILLLSSTPTGGGGLTKQQSNTLMEVLFFPPAYLVFFFFLHSQGIYLGLSHYVHEKGIFLAVSAKRNAFGFVVCCL